MGLFEDELRKRLAESKPKKFNIKLGDINNVKKMDNKITDLLDIPLQVGDTILGISGIEREVCTITEFDDISNGQATIMTNEGHVYFSQNVVRINDIVEQNAEYFV